MSLTNSSLWFSSGAGGGSFYPTLINDSLRWPTSGYQLYRTVGTPTDAKKHTHAFWVKVNPGTTQSLNSIYGNASGYYSTSGINNDGRIIFGADYARYYYSTMKLRDPSSWVHILQVLDSTEASGSDRLKLYVNGVRQTSFTNYGTPPLNWTGSYHATNGFGLRIGRTYTGGGFQSSLLSYTSEYIFVDGQALDPTDFGQFQDGVWIPDTYAGTYGNNGYKLDFSNPSDIGADSSGNGNNFSVTGLATHDVMPDTPTNNFPTINVIDPTINTSAISEANLKITEIANNLGGKATFAVPATGKWYWEAYCNCNANQEMWNGITGITTNSSGDGRGGSTNSNTYGASWSNYSGSDFFIRKYIAGVESAVSGSFGTTPNTVLGIAIDRDANEAKFYKDNALQFTTSISSTQEYFPAGGMGGGTNSTTIQVWNFGQDSSFAGSKTAQGNTDGNGQGDFYYSPPSGFLALCTANLPEPTIIDGSENFNTLLYTGNGANGRALTGVGFQPDWTWIKSRSVSRDHKITDSVRGVNKELGSQTTAAEVTRTNGLSVFGSDGFTVGSESGYNNSGDTFASWNWKARGTAVSNTAGSITSQVSANTDAGFSIVTYASNTGTVGHGLTQAPEAIIMKARNVTDQWTVGHKDLAGGSSPWNYGLPLNTTASTQTNGGFWNNTAPTSTVFSQGSWDAGYNKVAYCFHSVEGFSKAGSYTGNGSTNGTFVYTGFRPAWILIRLYDNGGTNWLIYDNKRDTYNVTDEALLPNSNSATGGSANALDMVSNGFKFRSSAGSLNANNYNYVYLAFAENPFKYANAR